MKDCTKGRMVICYRCGVPGHIATQCNQPAATVAPSVGSVKNVGSGPSTSAQGGGRGSVGKPAISGRVFAMPQYDFHAAPDVVTGTVTISGLNARVLFDSGSTFSFASIYIYQMVTVPTTSHLYAS